MKTLIIYASKHGAACEIAKRIAENMDGAVLHDIKKSKAPDLSGFDSVILGSSVYVGSIQKEAKEFVSDNKDILKQKKLGLFVSGLQPEEAANILKNNFPAELLCSAKAAEFLGGIFDPEKSGIMERLAVKAVAKVTSYINTIDDKKINQFTEAMKA